MKKHLFLLLLALLMAIAPARAYDFSAVTPSGQTLYYNINGNEVTLTCPGNNSWTGFTTPGGDLTIPSSVTYNSQNYYVTSIGNYAFYKCNDLTSVTITESVTSIGLRAFSNCSGLTSVNIGSSVTSIGERAFNGCGNLTSVNIGSSVTSIGNYAFDNCGGLTEVTFTTPSLLTSIGESAFNNCSSLDNVNIPNLVEIIGNKAFYYCTSLTSVTIPNPVTFIGNEVFVNCTSLTSVTIGSSVTSIGNYAFSNCTSLASVNIPDEVTSIGDYAFNNCTSLTSASVSIPDEVTSIGSHAFYSCTSLTSVNIPDKVTSIGDYAFSYCTGLTSVTIPNSVTSIGNSAFSNCTSLASVKIGSSVTSIGQYTFENCTDLKSIVLPSSVNSINSKAFKNCSNLKTFFNYSGLGITVGSDFNGATPDRVITGSDTTMTGVGRNALVKVSDVITTIPQDHLPVNYIAKVGSGWKANDIVLTDCQDAFNAPVGFTAASVTYTRTLTDGNRSTLCLPFTTIIPAELEVYEFTGFNNATLSFTQNGSGNIEAYKPYLVGKDLYKSTTDFTFTQTNAVFPATVPGSYQPVTHYNMTFQGVMKRTEMSNNGCWNYGYKDGYFVRSGGSAHVNPFRCYFTWNNAPQDAPAILGVDTDGDYLGIEEVEADAAQNGRIRYSNDVYDLMGRMVRKEASDLRGLPKGIYIWRGKKILNY